MKVLPNLFKTKKNGVRYHTNKVRIKLQKLLSKYFSCFSKIIKFEAENGTFFINAESFKHMMERHKSYALIDDEGNINIEASLNNLRTTPNKKILKDNNTINSDTSIVSSISEPTLIKEESTSSSEVFNKELQLRKFDKIEPTKDTEILKERHNHSYNYEIQNQEAFNELINLVYKNEPITDAELNRIKELIDLLNVYDINSNFEGKGNIYHSPLCICSVKGHLEVVKLLVQKGAKNTCGDSILGDGYSALHLAAKHGQLEIVKFLLRNGANPMLNAIVYQPEGYDRILLQSSIKPGNLECVRYLVAYAYDKDAYLDNGNTGLKEVIRPIQVAWNEDCVDILEYFLSENVPLTSIRTEISKENPLGHLFLVAAKEGKKNICEFFAKNKINPNFQDSAGRTALHYAAANRDPNLVNLLIISGADISVKDKDGLNYQEFAKKTLSEKALKGMVSRLRCFMSFERTNDFPFDNFKDCLSFITDINVPCNWENNTVLYYAMRLIDYEEMREYIKLLMEKGADPSIQNKDGISPLDEAITRLKNLEKHNREVHRKAAETFLKEIKSNLAKVIQDNVNLPRDLANIVADKLI